MPRARSLHTDLHSGIHRIEGRDAEEKQKPVNVDHVAEMFADRLRPVYETDAFSSVPSYKAQPS